MISDFVTLVKSKGLARTNRYKLTVPFPTGIGDVKSTSILCESVTLPGVNLATNPARTYGESREMPYEKMYDPVTCTFYLDSDLSIKKDFERWIDKVINPNTRSIGYYRDYVKDIQIDVLNIDDSSPYTVTLYEAYPKAINAIAMDAGSREIMKVAVILQYKYWKSNVTKEAVTATITPDKMGVFTDTALSNVFDSNTYAASDHKFKGL